MKKFLPIVCFCFFSLSVFAQTCNKSIPLSTPDARFDIQNEVVIDKMTGLMWKRCSEGQRWEQNACKGKANTFTFEIAQKIASRDAGYSDWRIPTISELDTIVELACYQPAINKKTFPNTPNEWFWSSSPLAYLSGYAWPMHFEFGIDYTSLQTGEYRVRLVRAGQ